MSLILDALKKLEREKGAGDPGVVVVGSVPWGERDRSRRPRRLALAGMGVLALAALGGLLLRPGAAPPGAPSASAGAPPTPAAAGPPPTPRPVARATPQTAPAPAPSLRPTLPAPATEATLVGEPPGATAADTLAPAAPAAPPPATPAHPPLRLSAISVQDGRPVAIIDDRLVREGDRFDGVLVLRIGEAEVEVEVAGRRETLRF